MQAKFMSAINQICEEKGIPKETILETVQAALAAAYKKDYGNKMQEVRVDLDKNSGKSTVYIEKEVVSKVEDSLLEISSSEAKKIKKNAKVGDKIEIKDEPEDFGRIAAQTAKQILIQRIREAEREIIFNEYKDRENDLVNGTIQRIEGNNVFVDLGKATGIVFPQEQIPGERYYIGQRIKVFVVKVEQTTKGPQILLSRSHPEMIKKLFETEVPEIPAGTVEIKSIAREAGQRSKIAVWTEAESIDPVGSCVGQRGVRVQSVMNELGEEKIDIILWAEDPKAYITNALSPAKVAEIQIDETEKRAKTKVPEDQLSLAIGKQGQNVRLAAKLTGWNIDIIGADEAGVEATAQATEKVSTKKKDLEEEIIKTVEEGNKKNEKKSENKEEKEIVKDQKKVKEKEQKKESQTSHKEVDKKAKVKKQKVVSKKPEEQEEQVEKNKPDASEKKKIESTQEEIQNAVEKEQTEGIKDKIIEEKESKSNPELQNQETKESDQKDKK